TLFAGNKSSPLVLGWDIAAGNEALNFKAGAAGGVMALGKGGRLVLNGNGWGRHGGWRIVEEGKDYKDPPTPSANLQIWNSATQCPVATVAIRDEKDKYGAVHCDAAVFSPDGRMAASRQISEYQGIRPSYGNARLLLCEQTSGQPIRTLAPT